MDHRTPAENIKTAQLDRPMNKYKTLSMNSKSDVGAGVGGIGVGEGVAKQSPSSACSEAPPLEMGAFGGHAVQFWPRVSSCTALNVPSGQTAQSLDVESQKE